MTVLIKKRLAYKSIHNSRFLIKRIDEVFQVSAVLTLPTPYPIIKYCYFEEKKTNVTFKDHWMQHRPEESRRLYRLKYYDKNNKNKDSDFDDNLTFNHQIEESKTKHPKWLLRSLDVL